MKRTIHFAAALLTTPIVPRFNPEGVQQTDPLRPPRAQGVGPDAFGAGLGTGLQQGARGAFAAVAEARAQEDRTAAIEARTKLDQAEVDSLYDPKNGALAKRGKNSFGIVEPALQAFDTKVGEIEKGLITPEQKNTFRLFAMQRRVEVDKQLQRHVHGEMKAYADETNKASLESTLNNAIRHYNDPERVEQERKFGLGVIMSDTANKGEPPEVVKMKAASWESMIHKGIIERHMTDNPVKAKEYFDQNRDKILEADATKIDHALRPMVKEVEVNAAVDEIMKSLPETASRSELVSAVRDKHKDKPWLREAEAEVRRLHADREDQRKKVIEDAEHDVYSYLAKVKLAGGVPKRSDVPQEAWAKLATAAPEKVDKIADEIRRGVEHATDRARTEQDRRETKATLDNLTTWGLLKTNPDTLRTTNLDVLLGQGKLSKTQYQDLITDQVSIRQGKGEHEKLLLSNKAAVDQVLNSVGIRDNPKNEKDSARYMKFYDALNDRMKLFEAENGKRPKQEEVKALARGLLAEVSQDVNFWPVDKAVRAFEADLTKVRVPAADRADIKRALQANGVAVTEDSIRRTYVERQMKKGGVR